MNDHVLSRTLKKIKAAKESRIAYTFRSIREEMEQKLKKLTEVAGENPDRLKLIEKCRKETLADPMWPRVP